MADSRPKRPTLRDVASLAGVSTQTVSRVINNHERVSSTTRTRVMEAIEDLGYRPNRAAQMLNTRRSFTLEVLTVDPETSLFRSTLGQMARAAQASGYSISFSVFTRGRLSDALESAAARMVDGTILIPSLMLPDFTDEVSAAIQQEIPSVQITPMLGLDAPSVSFNQDAGARMVARHLLELGHTQFAEISGRENMLETKIRHDAWVSTAQEYGVDPGPRVTGDFLVRGGYDAAQRLLAQREEFSALVCANDRMALGALHALHERGLKIPDDVSIVGFDNIEGADHFLPPLTTVAMDFAKMGQVAMDYLIEIIEQPDTPIYQRILMPELIVRKSTAPLPKSMR